MSACNRLASSLLLVLLSAALLSLGCEAVPPDVDSSANGQLGPDGSGNAGLGNAGQGKGDTTGTDAGTTSAGDAGAPCPSGTPCACTTGADCESKVCLTQPNGAKTCGVPCKAQKDCREDQKCEFVETNLPASHGNKTEKVKVCVADPNYKCKPKPEKCDGVDNDCNGLTDDGLCDDGNPCTTDACDAAAKACVHAANTAACDDANPCTAGDHCADGACTAGAPKVCDDGNPCTTDSCNEATGTCVSAPNSAPCDDGDACTAGDTCGNGACVSGAGVGCDDGNSCT